MVGAAHDAIRGNMMWKYKLLLENEVVWRIEGANRLSFSFLKLLQTQSEDIHGAWGKLGDSVSYFTTGNTVKGLLKTKMLQNTEPPRKRMVS